ncbi:MAG TPA: extracellular solute-binding protein [Armatimonadota bacterium]|nr:extracellular solute-binding protein [Armatimonadota bacterium]
MKRILPAICVLAILLVVIVGCAKKQTAQKGQIQLEVASFQGGFGLDFFEYAAREYEKTHPNVKINLWGNPRVWEQLRPRFIKGNPPDLAWPGWGMDYWGLVAEGKVLPMDKYLETKAYGQDKKWIDTFDMRLLNKGKYEGHYYIMPYNQNVFGWWYNVDMFKQHGWQPPKTYDELLVLCEKIKKAGIAPITFQGRYPAYMLRGFLFPWAISEGGLQAFNDAQNLKPGAWKSPAFLKAANMVAELRDKGYFQKGAMGMSHTEAQMEFVLGRAAMIPCGTWLGSEMKDQLPKGFHMAFINPPVIEGGKGDPTITSAGVETWIIPADGKNHDLAADFFKFMTSLDMAKQFVIKKNTLMAIKGSDDQELPPDLVGAAECAAKASALWDADYANWYQTMRKDVESAMAALLNKEKTPEQALAAMEKLAQATAKDSSIPKHRVE